MGKMQKLSITNQTVGTYYADLDQILANHGHTSKQSKQTSRLRSNDGYVAFKNVGSIRSMKDVGMQVVVSARKQLEILHPTRLTVR